MNGMAPIVTQRTSESFSNTTDLGIDISDLVFSIWQGKWVIIITTILSIFTGGYYAFVMVTPVYRSSSVVILEPKTDKIVTFQSVSAGLTGDTPEVNSEVEILRARSLMHTVAQHLNLFSDTEFNRTLTPPNAKVVLKSQIKQKLGWNAAPQELSPKNFDQRIRDTVVSALLQKTRIENLRQSTVFRITVQTKEAAKSALIADTIAELYIQNQVTRKIATAAQATVWLEQRVSELQVELEHAETTATDFSASTELISPESLQALRHQIKALRERVTASQHTLMLSSLNVKSLENAKDLQTKIAAANDDQLSAIARGDTQNTAFNDRFETIKIRAISDLSRTQKQLETLKQSEVELSAQIASQGQDLITLRQLNREAEASRVLYEHFLTRLKETASQQGIQRANSRVLSPAVIPYKPSEPRKSLILSMSAIFGLAASLCFLFFKELRRTTFRSCGALEREFRIPSFASQPTLPVNRKEDFLEYLNVNPACGFANSIRALRTTLLLSPTLNPRFIAISSAQPSEGCAATAVALTFDLSQQKKKVLLIDASQTDDSLHAYFGDEPTRGLASVLRGEHGIDQAIHRPNILGADILFANDTSAQVSDLFLTEEFETFVSNMKDRYDVIVISAPAISTSPTIIAALKFADATILSVKWDSTTKQQLTAALRILNLADIGVTNLMLSSVKRVNHQVGFGSFFIRKTALETAPASL